LKVPVARCKSTNVWSCSHSGSKTQCQQWVGRAAGADVGTNLIDGHYLAVVLAIVGTNLIDGHPHVFRQMPPIFRCRRRHQPDRRTQHRLRQQAGACRGADVGTNLIDGHFEASATYARHRGADVGTNLIDGHETALRPFDESDGADVGTNLIDGHSHHEPSR